MLRGLYTSASSMLVTQKKLDIISNNLSNAATTGFKKDEVVQESFSEVLMYRLEAGKRTANLGKVGNGVRLRGTYTDFMTGKMKYTGNDLDLAIEGNGFFVVETPQGKKYTRNGNFRLNHQNQIVTQQGYPVLGERGPLQTINGREINISEDGQVYLGDLKGDSFLIVDFNDKDLLNKGGDNLYELGEAREEINKDFNLKQGYLEDSNVKIVQEMVKMIETNRLYELNQKMIQNSDNILSKAVNEIARF